MMIGAVIGLGDLFAGVPTSVVSKDAATVVHLVAMAVALGSVLTHDVMVMRYAKRPISGHLIGSLLSVHHVITGSLIVLWLSGLVLIGHKTGFVWAEFSPKLIAKVSIVTMLTITAVVMKIVAMPRMMENVGLPLLSIPFQTKLVLAACAGMSFGGWMTAVVLGGMSFLKTAAADQVITMVLLIQGGALFGALMAAVAGHMFMIATIVSRLLQIPDYSRTLTYIPAE